MYKSKTKVMIKNDTPLNVTNTQIKNVESCIYLGQRYSTRDKNQDKEVKRRFTAGWTAFAKHRDIFKGNIGTCLKRLRTFSNDIRRRNMGTHHPCKELLAAAQTMMERRMLNIIYRDRKTHIWVIEKTKVTGVIEHVRRRKWA